VVAALTAALLLAASSAGPRPVAAFSVPSQVTTGETISYIDRSYDPAPGHHITLKIWIGRQVSFESPGHYTVSLSVEDDRGLWSTASHTITVATKHRPPPPPTGGGGGGGGTLTLSATEVQRGDEVVVTVTPPAGAVNLQLSLPQAFYISVSFPTGLLDYQQVNGGAFAETGGTYAARFWVPWTKDLPADGSYTIRAVWTADSSQGGASATLQVHGTDQLVTWQGD